MRAVALSCPPPALDACLRGTYRAFAQNAKFVTAASLPHIHFMGAAVVEMTRLDAGARRGRAGARSCPARCALCSGGRGPPVLLKWPAADATARPSLRIPCLNLIFLLPPSPQRPPSNPR